MLQEGPAVAIRDWIRDRCWVDSLMYLWKEESASAAVKGFPLLAERARLCTNDENDWDSD